METHFSNAHVTLFISAFLTGAIAVVFFLRKNHGGALLFLIVAGILLRSAMITIDPFIWLWDEQFHALVAKNMMAHPFKPTMYEIPVLNYDYRLWDQNHIWLHKQPLFLWQMALSMKIFGASEWAMRLPSAVMSVLLIPVVYRMGAIILNREVGFYAAFLTTFSFLYNEIVTGSQAGDHNDVAFLFYVTLSLWAWTEFTVSNNFKWVYAIGVFAGCAVLVKWLPGLLVFAGFGMVRLTQLKQFSFWQWIKPLLVAFSLALLVFLPWLLYCYAVYPKEMSWELYMYHLHFSIPVEGHTGDWTYHFTMLPYLYSEIGSYLTLPAIVLLMVVIKNNSLRIGICTFLGVTYIFYTLSLTKMPYFTIIISAFIMLALGYMLQWLFNKIISTGKPWLAYPVVVILLMGSGLYFFNHHAIELRHTNTPISDGFRGDRITKTEKYKMIVGSIKDEKYVFFNCDKLDRQIIMFYSGMPAYDIVPTENEINQIIKKGFAVYVFDNAQLPENIRACADIEQIISL